MISLPPVHKKGIICGGDRSLFISLCECECQINNLPRANHLIKGNGFVCIINAQADFLSVFHIIKTFNSSNFHFVPEQGQQDVKASMAY